MSDPTKSRSSEVATDGTGDGRVESVAQMVSSRLRDIPDFPQPGVLFKDFTPLLADGPAFARLVRDTAGRYDGLVDVVVGIEARGFVLAAAVAYELGLGMVLVRKAGKLPGETVTADYELEYGTATLEVARDAFRPDDRVLLVDDVLATGGTAKASAELVTRQGGEVIAFAFVIELAFLSGRGVLSGNRVESVLTY